MGLRVINIAVARFGLPVTGRPKARNPVTINRNDLFASNRNAAAAGYLPGRAAP
jgi:hypothetical protein